MSSRPDPTGRPIGHRSILERLTTATDAGTLHHAYLFEGPPGLGKRAVADWLALYTNCRGAQKPCGRCQQCTTIAAGTHPDVIVLEPDPSRASRTIGVDAVRDVIRKAGYHRFDSERRFIVVDPADAMLEPAANALLKTLEEPPEGTGFILIATSASRLLPTIVSRCQRIRFGAVPTETIQAWLERRGANDARAAAAMALGCPGRALALAEGGLEQRREARSMLERPGDLPKLFAANEKLVKGKPRAIWAAKVDVLLEVLEELLRDATVHAAGADQPLLHHDAPRLVEHWAARLYPDGIDRMRRAIVDARDQLEVNVAGRTVLDALLTRLSAELGR